MDAIDRRFVLGAGLALAAASPARAQAQPVARTAYGRVRGAQAGGVLSFKGVRYGAPTSRFQAPAAPRRTSVFRAHSLRAARDLIWTAGASPAGSGVASQLR